MDTDKILAHCDEIDQLTQAIRDEVLGKPPAPPAYTLVHAGDDLQAYLNAGGTYQLAAGAVFARANGFSLPVPGTVLCGLGQNLVAGEGLPALDVPTGVQNVQVESVLVRVLPAADVGIRVGRNTVAEQSTVAQAPVGVTFSEVQAVSLRGKRAFEIHGVDIELAYCEVVDQFDPENLDSQAIWIGNAPGPVLVRGGYFEAASENLMVGGDVMKIPDCRPTGITVRGATFKKPPAWKLAGIPKVKNICELKDGHDVLFEQCTLAFCWVSAQDGYAFTFTPTNGGSLQNVIVRECQVEQVSGIVNMTGQDKGLRNEQRTQVTFQGGAYRTNKAEMSGRGIFALVSSNGSPSCGDWLRIESIVAEIDGNCFIDVAERKPLGQLRLVGSTWNYGSYGIRIGGYSHGDNQLGVIGHVEIEGNTIRGAHSAFRDRYPHNTYLENMARDRELFVDAEQQLEAEQHESDEAVANVRRWLQL